MAPGDRQRRDLILRRVIERAAERGGVVTYADLAYLPIGLEGDVRVISRGRGIWNPKDFDATLSVVSSPDGPYDDREVEGGLIHYAYEAGSVDGSNAKLRRAYELQVPIIFLKKIQKGTYVPFAPVYVVGDDPVRREFLLALDESVRFLPSNLDPDAPQKRYAERLVRQRLHQAEFRGRVILAYETRCAICLLAHGELLDAAHIIEDASEQGIPVVSNGLALCKIHHAAYDRNLIGLSPDYHVHVDAELLAEVDGPMLKHGLQEMHGRVLRVPSRRAEQPDRDRLAERFRQFRERAG